MSDRERLAALIEPVLERAGAELIDLEVAGGGGRPIVRVYADREGGVTVDDCARLSRLVEAELESAGAVPERYVLEVSSPGIERPLTTRRHFERYLGREISLRLYAKKEGRRQFVGTLERVIEREGGSFAIVLAGAGDETGGERTFESGEIARAKLYIRW